jgi:branched-chain amino acid transport system ATP-binding protein
MAEARTPERNSRGRNPAAAAEEHRARALELRELTKHFGGIHAVNAVSTRVDPGEIVAVVGPNGAGKTTLLQLITGIIQPDAGRILFGERDLTGAPPEAAAAEGIARAFQTSRVFPVLTVWDSVRIGGLPYVIGGGRYGRRVTSAAEMGTALFGGRRVAARERELDARTEATLKLFGERLWPRRHDAAQSLSYANRRRLELARTLVADPLLLLLDEPTAGMNPTETRELVELIGELQQERPYMSILIIEHKMDVVRMLARRAVVMDHGAVIAEGSPEAVLEQENVVEAYLGRRSST